MEKRRRFWTLCACSGLAIVGTRPSLAAEWLIDPTGRIGTLYASNPRLLRNSVADGDWSVATVGELNAALQRRTERSEFSLQPRLYSERHEDFPVLDRDDRSLRTRFTYGSPRLQWNASADLVYDTTLTSELGLTGLVDSNRPHEGTSLSGGPTYLLSERTNAGMQAYWNHNHYRDARFTGLLDYEYAALSVFAGHSLSSRTQLTFITRAGELHVPDFPLADKQDASAVLKWRYQLARSWSAEVAAGPSYARSDIASDDGLVLRGELEHREERWTYSISAGRDVTPTGRGGLIRRDQASLSASHWWTPRLVSSVTLHGVRNQELLVSAGLPGDELHYGRIELKFNWRWTERVSVAGGFTGLTQQMKSRRNSDVDNYTAAVSIIWNVAALSL